MQMGFPAVNTFIVFPYINIAFLIERNHVINLRSVSGLLIQAWKTGLLPSAGGA